jgi:hypothetical protein
MPDPRRALMSLPLRFLLVTVQGPFPHAAQRPAFAAAVQARAGQKRRSRLGTHSLVRRRLTSVLPMEGVVKALDLPLSEGVVKALFLPPSGEGQDGGYQTNRWFVISPHPTLSLWRGLLRHPPMAEAAHNHRARNGPPGISGHRQGRCTPGLGSRGGSPHRSIPALDQPGSY